MSMAECPKCGEWEPCPNHHPRKEEAVSETPRRDALFNALQTELGETGKIANKAKALADYDELCRTLERALADAERRARGAEKDAERWNALFKLHPMDIATEVCGAPTDEALRKGLTRRVDAALAQGGSKTGEAT